MNEGRRKLDFYETHEKLTWEMLRRREQVLRLDLGSPPVFLEPCSGDGAIADILSIKFPDSGVIRNDIDPERTADYHLDMAEERSWRFLRSVRPFDWVITNPPFTVANQIVPYGVRFARRGAIFLLRLTWLEPTQGRREFWKYSDLPLGGFYPINPRPVFRVNKDGKPGTDSVTVAWFIWDRFQGRRVTFDLQFITGWK
jgi:hypothetical protein